jgi:hypothetical protein
MRPTKSYLDQLLAITLKMDALVLCDVLACAGIIPDGKALALLSVASRDVRARSAKDMGRLKNMLRSSLADIRSYISDVLEPDQEMLRNLASELGPGLSPGDVLRAVVMYDRYTPTGPMSFRLFANLETRMNLEMPWPVVDGLLVGSTGWSLPINKFIGVTLRDYPDQQKISDVCQKVLAYFKDVFPKRQQAFMDRMDAADEILLTGFGADVLLGHPETFAAFPLCDFLGTDFQSRLNNMQIPYLD